MMYMRVCMNELFNAFFLYIQYNKMFKLYIHNAEKLWYVE